MKALRSFLGITPTDSSQVKSASHNSKPTETITTEDGSKERSLYPKLDPILDPIPTASAPPASETDVRLANYDELRTTIKSLPEEAQKILFKMLDRIEQLENEIVFSVYGEGGIEKPEFEEIETGIVENISSEDKEKFDCELDKLSKRLVYLEGIQKAQKINLEKNLSLQFLKLVADGNLSKAEELLKTSPAQMLQARGTVRILAGDILRDVTSIETACVSADPEMFQMIVRHAQSLEEDPNVLEEIKKQASYKMKEIASQEEAYQNYNYHPLIKAILEDSNFIKLQEKIDREVKDHQEKIDREKRIYKRTNGPKNEEVVANSKGPYYTLDEVYCRPTESTIEEIKKFQEYFKPSTVEKGRPFIMKEISEAYKIHEALARKKYQDPNNNDGKNLGWTSTSQELCFRFHVIGHLQKRVSAYYAQLFTQGALKVLNGTETFKQTTKLSVRGKERDYFDQGEPKPDEYTNAPFPFIVDLCRGGEKQTYGASKNGDYPQFLENRIIQRNEERLKELANTLCPEKPTVSDRIERENPSGFYSSTGNLAFFHPKEGIKEKSKEAEQSPSFETGLRR